jgi:cytoskeletal protein CcmA (bactofilin family)
MPEPTLRETDATSILGPRTSVTGELTVNGPVHILGTFEGAIRGATEVLVGPQGKVTASLEADVVVIEGSLRGDVVARQRLQLGPKAHVQGDLTAGSLIVAEGATFMGRVGVGADAMSKPTLESKPVSPRPLDIVTPATADWLTQSAKTPSWVRAATGAD